jgi:hypothetical protein
VLSNEARDERSQTCAEQRSARKQSHRSVSIYKNISQIEALIDFILLIPCVWYISLTTPPTIVENVLPPTPAKKRATNIPGKERVTAQDSWQMTNNIPVVMKTGLLPLSSEKGARTMGAIAKPVVKVVIPTYIATWLTCQYSDIC